MLIVADSNFDIPNISNTNTLIYLNTLHINGAAIFNDQPTRVIDSTASLIDHVTSTLDDRIVSFDIKYIELDHKAMFVSICGLKKKEKTPMLKRKVYTLDKERFT